MADDVYEYKVQIVVSPLDGAGNISNGIINVTSPRPDNGENDVEVKQIKSKRNSQEPCQAHNRFHHNCCSPKKATSIEDIKALSAQNAEKMRSKTRGGLSGSKQDLRGSKSNLSMNGRKSDSDGLDANQFTEIVSSRPDLLEQYILDHMDLDTLEKLTQRRAKKLHKPTKITSRKTSLGKWKFSVEADKRNMLEEMTEHLVGSTNKAQIMWELSNCISSAVDADVFNLYLVQSEGEITEFSPDLENPGGLTIKSGSTLAAHCAKVKDVMRVNTGVQDPRFPKGVPGIKGAAKVLCYPVCSDTEELEAVIELIRKKGNNFTEEDVEIVNSYLVWGGVTIHFADLYSKVQHQKSVNDFLLSVVKSIFQEMISMDTLIVQIMNQAQKLVDADRASLFLVDAKTNQLYARIFDVSCEENEDGDPSQGTKEIRDKVRFPIGKGIAGHVAQTGATLNVADAYKDDRFNPAIDEETGYTTKSILCMPICIRGSVIGVVQMINKKNGGAEFTKEDEESFKTFAVYCGLALHHAKLYDKIRRSEQKYKVALEVLSYHNAASVDEVEELITEGIPVIENHEDISSQIFTYYATGLDDMSKVRKALFMFVDLFGVERFEYETLVRFFITVKKNYRAVAYHNWAHGFHVANSIYSILKASPGIFRPLECLAMFVGAICHDLDHRGFNNKFMIDIGSPLAAIYSTSTMEHHHFNMAVNILQQEHHNIFARLNPDEYKQVLGNMKHCILATDLALFFPNKARLGNIVKENTFSWDLPDHRLLAQALCMTGSDLNSSAKPWEIQFRTSAVVYSEFHEQGDVEKSLGWKPIPLFDRDNYGELASMQAGFIMGICLPCYDLLIHVLPTIEPMLEGCKVNLGHWKDLKAAREKEKEAEKKD